jgi:hypothetical protein
VLLRAICAGIRITRLANMWVGGWMKFVTVENLPSVIKSQYFSIDRGE